MFPEFQLPLVPLNSLLGDTLLLHLSWSCHCLSAAIFQINIHFSYLILLPRTTLCFRARSLQAQRQHFQSSEVWIFAFSECHMSRNLKMMLIKVVPIFDHVMLGSLLEMLSYFWARTAFLSYIDTISSRADFWCGTPLCSRRERKKCSITLFSYKWIDLSQVFQN